MKIAIIIIRTLIGLLLLYASISFFLKLAPEPEVTGNFKAFNVGLVANALALMLMFFYLGSFQRSFKTALRV